MRPFILYYPAVILTFIIIPVHIMILCGVLLNRVRDLFLLKRRNIKKETAGSSLSVSVIVAARDEENNLPNLFESLKKQTVNEFEIVLINDRSSDGTEKIMKEFKDELGGRVKIIRNDKEPEECNPKQFVLDLGIKEAAGDLFLFTDADCTVAPEWIEYYRHYFKNPKTGVVFGQLLVKGDNSFFERYQSFDQLLVHQYNSGTAGLGILTGCFGNNLGARREVINEVGGFRSLGYTPTEDAAFLGAVSKLKKWKGRVSTLKQTMIHTLPQKSWKGFVSQHVRWNSGGFYAADLQSRIGYRFVVLYLTVSILLIPLAFFFPFLFMLPATSFVFPGLLAFTAGMLYHEDRTSFLLWFVPSMLIFMFFYSLATVLAILKISVKWKGTALKT